MEDLLVKNGQDFNTNLNTLLQEKLFGDFGLQKAGNSCQDIFNGLIAELSQSSCVGQVLKPEAEEHKEDSLLLLEAGQLLFVNLFFVVSVAACLIDRQVVLNSEFGLTQPN